MRVSWDLMPCSSVRVSMSRPEDVFIGRRIVKAEDNIVTLDNGVMVEFDTEESCCCSTIDLSKLCTVEHVITDVVYSDTEDQTGGEGPYTAWMKGVTEAGEFIIAEADGDASNGYYLHGFTLGFKILERI